MDAYKSVIQGLTEAVDYQQGKINTRKTRLSIKPVATFNNADIKRIRLKPSDVCRLSWGLTKNSGSMGKRTEQAGRSFSPSA